MRMLFVDDDPDILGVLQCFASREMHESFTARNGKEALDIFEREDPDVVIMDIQMPLMNGIESARIMKVKRNDIYIVLASSCSRKDLLDDARNVADMVVDKVSLMVDFKEIMKKIEKETR